MLLPSAHEQPACNRPEIFEESTTLLASRQARFPRKHPAGRPTARTSAIGQLIAVKWITGWIVEKNLHEKRDICSDHIRVVHARYQPEQTPRDRELNAQAEKQLRLSQRGVAAVENSVAPWAGRRHQFTSGMRSCQNGQNGSSVAPQLTSAMSHLRT